MEQIDQNGQMEMELWEYIDGLCNEADRQRIAALITTDKLWQLKFEEINEVNLSLASAMEMEQPSMRFTKNVMEAVANVNIAPATKKYVNNSIVKGIAAFFIISIVSLLGYALASAKWSKEPLGISDKLNIPKVDLSPYFNSSFFNIIIGINVVLGLVILDLVMRRKNNRELEKQIDTQ